MKIANTIPFKAVLALASITTIGVIALTTLDTEVVDHGVPVPVATEPVNGCRLPREHPSPPPIHVAPTPPATVASF